MNNESFINEKSQVANIAKEMAKLDLVSGSSGNVSMRMPNNVLYHGLRLYDESLSTIVDSTWVNNEDAEWTSLLEIPKGSRIIGLKCDTDSYDTYLINLSFLTGESGQIGSTGELKFPQLDAFIHP